MPLATDIGFALAPLRAMLGADAVYSEPEDIAPYLRDERGAFQGSAGLMVRPASTGEVSQLLAYCSQNAIAVVPQGGNTGYCGGATPDDADNQVLLCLGRMNGVRAVDPVGFTMTVDAGLVLALSLIHI